MRNLTHHVSRGGGYEFEDVICDCDEVDMLAPVAYRPRGKNRITRKIDAILWERRGEFNREIRVATEYDLFFAFCLNSAGARATHGAYARGVQLRFIRPGKPIENAFIESFNGKFRDECLNEHWLPASPSTDAHRRVARRLQHAAST